MEAIVKSYKEQAFEGRGCVKVKDKSIRLKLKVLRQHGRWKPQIDNFLRWLSTVTSDRF